MLNFVAIAGKCSKLVKEQTLEELRTFLEDPDMQHPNVLSMIFIDAARNNRIDIVKFLLSDTTFDPSKPDQYPVLWAASTDRVEVLKLLLTDPRVNPAIMERDIFNKACSHGYADVVKVLLEDRRVDPSVGGSELLQASLWGNHHEIAKLLLEDGRVPFDSSVKRLMRNVARDDRVKMFEVLLQDKRSNPMKSNAVLISIICEAGAYGCLKLILKDPRVDITECSCLTIAARENFVGIKTCLNMLLADPRCDPRQDDYMCLYQVHPQNIRIILNDPRVDLNKAKLVNADVRKIVEPHQEENAAIAWCFKQMGGMWPDTIQPVLQRREI